jgi:hypothetical protein
MPVFRLSASWLWITFLAIAMAFVESAVVIYLRELYYPAGFQFPMVIMTGKIAGTEFLREIATLIMLLSMGYLTGTNARERFAWFIYSFAIWDIFYYVFLKLILNWPESWFTWDVLFLVPVVWTGPVLAPLLVSLTMIALAFTLLHMHSRPGSGKIHRPAVWCIITGSVLVFLSFIWDFLSFMNLHYSVSEAVKPGIATGALLQYIPRSFNWPLLILGELCIFSGIISLLIRDRTSSSTHA